MLGKERFDSSLTDRKINDKEHQHLFNVFDKFGIKTMKDYQFAIDKNLYLKCDVLLLADAFEKFRNNSLENYGLCPCHYLRSQSTLSRKIKIH